MQRRHLALICLLASWIAVPSPLPAQDGESWAGKRVMVVRWAAELKAGTDVVARARLGNVLLVDQVKDEWLWIKGQRGWIKKGDVVLYDRAIDHFTAAINRNPTSQAYHERGIAWAVMKQYDKAAADFDTAIARDPKNIPAVNERGNVHRKMGQLERAIADFNEVIRQNVRHPAVYTNRGMVWRAKGDDDRALADYNEALRIDPNFAPAYEAAGTARQDKRDYGKAVENFAKAVQIAPGFDLAHNNLAWILATCPDERFRDGNKAVTHATKACELTDFQRGDYLDTLAASHAEAGQFDQAVQRAKESLEKATAQQKDAIAARLKLYEQRKPFREQAQ